MQPEMGLKCEQNIATTGMENPFANLLLSKPSTLQSLDQDVLRVLCGESRDGSRQNVSQHSVLVLESKRGTLGGIYRRGALLPLDSAVRRERAARQDCCSCPIAE
jgi:hypothetical protein